jgi:rhodanese-related sulfurtransferase
MKNIKTALIVAFLAFGFLVLAQNPINWNEKQLMEPSTLAATIKSGKDIPKIFSVGPGAVIPNSVDIGMGKETANIQKLRDQLAKLPKSTKIVVYCGCCPFEHCPNVRPAIAALKELKFTNYYLLNLPKNIKTDWIDKGYPVNK